MAAVKQKRKNKKIKKALRLRVMKKTSSLEYLSFLSKIVF